MKTEILIKAIQLITSLSAVITIASSQIILDSIPDGSGYTFIASPTGPGPFPSILYNHGGLGTTVGGDLRGTVIALAQSGYFARAEKRMETVPIAGHLAEVEAALDLLRADPRADTNCVAIIGFSRGAYLTLEAAKQNPGKVHCIIAMAPANPGNLLDSFVTNVSPIDDPTLILVANNDTFQDEHIILAQMVYDSLIAEGKTATLNIYPDYDSNGDLIINDSDDGHELFFVVQNPYWADVINFLNANSCNISGLNNPNQGTSLSKIYPNPLSQYATIEFENPKSENCTLTIYNTSGQLVQTITDITTNKIEIERQNLLKGLYFFRLHIDRQVIANGKLMVE